MEEKRSASREEVWSQWPRYRAAVEGFRDYWYPVVAARQLGRKPISITLCGEKIALVREGRRVHGLRDRCPHRGVPLSQGRRVFPGALTCAYHGWTYDLESGELAAVLTDGPDSPICGKASVRVKTYPVEERAGLLWVYVGDPPAPPVEEDIPEELLRSDAVINGLSEIRQGNWRYATENAVDEGHAKYLHRNALWSIFSEFPAWTNGVGMRPSEDGKYLMRFREKSVFEDVYPRFGRWPKRRDFWRRKNRGPSISLGMRLPCISRVVQGGGWTDYEIFVPVDAEHHLAIFLAVRWTVGLDAWLWRLRYWTYIRWFYYGLLNRAQDGWMISMMNIPPEQLYRPDVSVTAWRTWCEEHARVVRTPMNGPAEPCGPQEASSGASASAP